MRGGQGRYRRNHSFLLTFIGSNGDIIKNGAKVPFMPAQMRQAPPFDPCPRSYSSWAGRDPQATAARPHRAPALARHSLPLLLDAYVDCEHDSLIDHVTADHLPRGE